MELTATPVRRTGERNLYCPYYSGCLDHAVQQNWGFWSCSQCRNQTLKDPFNGVDIFTDFSSEYVSVPNSILRMIERYR
jgi:hypothetical protein